MTYTVQPFGNRWQLVSIEGTLRTPLFPAYASLEEANAERSARERRDAALLHRATR